MTASKKAAVIIALLISALTCSIQAKPTNLMCELLTQPQKTNITDSKPEFGWNVNQQTSNDFQTAYQILVASSIDKLNADTADIWDSGKVNSNQSTNVEFQGQTLLSGKSYFWKVKTWNKDSKPSDDSDTQQFNFYSKPKIQAPAIKLKNCKWLWADKSKEKSKVWFRKTFNVPDKSKVKKATLYITADDKLVLYFNYKIAYSTHGLFTPWKNIRVINITESLIQGKNTIALDCLNQGKDAGMVAKVEIIDNQNNVTEILSDTSWKVTKKPADGWQDVPSYDDSNWSTPVIIADYGKGPWENAAKYETKEIANRYIPEVSYIKPERIVKKADGHYFIDFGKMAFGTIELTLKSNDDRKLEIHLGEALGKDDKESVNRKPGHCIRYSKHKLTIKKVAHKYKLALPFIHGTIKIPKKLGNITPFRVVEIMNCPVKLKTENITQVAVFYPFDDNASYFESSNKTLDRVWNFCKYSIKATSFCGYYVDGDRERRPYEADAYINQLSHYAVDHEYTMARNSQDYLVKNATWPTEWILHTVLMAWEDYLQTANTDFIADHYNDLKAKTLTELAREDGLISTTAKPQTKQFLKSIHRVNPIRDIVDYPHGYPANAPRRYGHWAYNTKGNCDGYVFKDYNTVVNTVHYKALKAMAVMSKAIGKNEDSKFYSERAKLVKNSINKLIDEARGTYFDGEGTDNCTLHASMFPASVGIAPEKYHRCIKEHLTDKGMVCGVYGAQYYLEALYQLNLSQYAIDLMTSTGERSWCHMMDVLGTTVAAEVWDPKYGSGYDWNHAWATAPANIIPKFLVGVTPLEPGFGKIQIKPQPANLEFFKAKVPTIKGPVFVDYQNRNNTFILEINIPANTTAKVCLPKTDIENAKVTIDGKTVKAVAEADFLIIDNITSGKHKIEKKL